MSGGAHGAAAVTVATEVVFGEAFASLKIVGKRFDDEFVANGHGVVVLFSVISSWAVAIVLGGFPEEVAGVGVEGANIVADGFFVAGVLEDDAALCMQQGTVLDGFGKLQGLPPGFFSGFQIEGDEVGSV